MVKRMGKYFATGLALMLLVFAAACQDNKPVSDSALMDKAKQALAAYENVAVTVQGGVVTLTGTVASEQDKTAISGLISKIPGVKSVDNKLEMLTDAEPPLQNETSQQSAGEYLDDSVITTRVKSALAANVSLSSLDISVATMNKVVTLTGAVKNQEVIDLAGKVAGEVEGVKAVDNQLQIGTD